MNNIFTIIKYNDLDLILNRSNQIIGIVEDDAAGIASLDAYPIEAIEELQQWIDDCEFIESYIYKKEYSESFRKHDVGLSDSDLEELGI